MRKSATLLAGLSMLALAACSTGAEQETFTATIAPLNAGTATGSVQVVSDGVQLSKYTVTVSNQANVGGVHIHLASNNATVVTLFDGPATAATSVTNKSTFSQASLSGRTYDQFMGDLRDGAAYADVHMNGSAQSDPVVGRGDF